jgi:hypothetical protein
LISIHPNVSDLGKGRRYAEGFQTVLPESTPALAALITRHAWSPCVWLDGRRAKQNFQEARFCVLDFDDGLSLAQAERMFADCWHIIGTTKSHQLAKGSEAPVDRFRVVLRFSETIRNADDFPYTMSYWINRFGADESCKDAARFYWPCREIHSMALDGDTVDVYTAPPRPPAKNYSAYRAAGAIPAYLHPVLRKGAPEGERNSTCFRLGAELTRCGFDADRVHQIVAKSPIDLPNDEKWRAVDNGIKAAMAEGDK